MDSIRIDNGIKTIQVNDAGDCIQFSVTDANFFDGFFEFAHWLESKETLGEIEKIDAEKENLDTEKAETIERVATLQKGLIVQAMEKIDKIFGADASRKIFCGTIPLDLSLIADFIEQITPYIEKYTKERSKKISSKYSVQRKGAKS